MTQIPPVFTQQDNAMKKKTHTCKINTEVLGIGSIFYPNQKKKLQ